MFAKRIESSLKKMTSMVPSTSGSILNNKWFLYVALFAGIYELFNYYNRGDMYAVATFFLIGIVVSFFSKNMLAILVLAIALTRLIRYGRNLSEGFQDEEDEEEEGEEEGFEGDSEEKKEGEEKKDGFEGKTQNKIDSTAATVEDAASGKPVDTATLLKNQKDLMDSMKELEPFLAKAESFLASNAKDMNTENFATLTEAYSNNKLTGSEYTGSSTPLHI